MTEIVKMTHEHSMAQVDGMEGHSKVKITKEQRELYSILRDMTKEAELPSDLPIELLKYESVRVLTDQRLLAEVIHATGGANLGIFKKAYPNIFV